ncbi:hypothetical protein KUTeg_007725 [Tegillarca granosa]|uniref:Uncharacterized protein n=1 Tax=Tegillarca granosa TaxID=220873 RepID=A0ABQ9FE40_TEGGR|nr:hypothetical protein KUTeg_007725 [Tegillarca granosa]
MEKNYLNTNNKWRRTILIPTTKGKELSLSQSVDTYAVNNKKIILQSNTAYVNGERVSDKEHACVFCKELDKRISRHLWNVHKKEKAIKKLFDLSEKETSKELDRLRLLGDYNHNIEVLKRNKGLFIVPRHSSTVDDEKYNTTIFCHAYTVRASF